jgi:hypothetical protein
MLNPSLVLVALLAVTVESAHGQTPEKGKTWYPKGDDLCAELVIKTLKPGYGQIVTPTRDPAIAKYVEDVNRATGRSDTGGAMLGLLTYCLTHAAERLDHVTAAAVITYVQTRPSDEDKAAAESWHRNTLTQCGSSEECKRLMNKTYDDTLACWDGNPKACNDRYSDYYEVGRWNGRAEGSAQSNSQATLQQCLQDTAARAMKACKETSSCEGRVMMETIRYAQQAGCGYSALQAPQLPQPPQPPPLPTHCMTMPLGGGVSTTSCY